jgi:purine catabolism regulator
MLSEKSLRLTLLGEGRTIDDTLQWIHSSDLADPTPFLDSGQMLVTTGTQFQGDATQLSYDDYVERLVRRGVVALGFGSGVVRPGTPSELIASCAQSGLALIEVPYSTPFIAVVRWAAEVIAREAHERDDWSLRAQRAVSLAAVGQRGLAGVFVTLAKQLKCRVAVFELDGSFDAVISPSQFGANELRELSAAAVRLLRADERSATSSVIDGHRAVLQTLGPRGQLGGVLAIVGAKYQDSAAQAVLTNAIALAEISFEQSRVKRGSVMPLHEELFSLLLADQSEIVFRALPGLPRDDLRVVLCRPESQSQWFIEAVERRASTTGSRPFLAPYSGNLVVLVTSSQWPVLGSFLAEHEVTTGASNPTGLDRLVGALAQAKYALEQSIRVGRAVTEFWDVSDGAFLDIVSGQSMIDLATARLASLLADDHGRQLLANTFVWLAHNGVWDSAANELGMHRHSLKSRVGSVARTLNLSLDSFADRAQLWSMLYALDFEASGDVR